MRLFIHSLILLQLSGAFLIPKISTRQPWHPIVDDTTERSKSCLHLAKATKKKKKKSRGTKPVGGVKGFGSSSPSKEGGAFTLDRSKKALAFYDFLEKSGAGDNLKRAALAYFPLPNGDRLRGVVALKDLKKGDVIIRIPYEVAVNLGPEGSDPTLPGKDLLALYCNALRQGGSPTNEMDHTAYFRMLPEFMGDDCRGSTDFFSADALDALQTPFIVEETMQRRERVKSRFTSDVASNPSFGPWIEGSLTQEHLRWAVWLITSRVLTVQGDATEGRSYRLLIPFLDMCNHDRSSPHVLTGRAVPNGELKVVAGAPVAAGEQINICYGGGVAGNDRFLQDYGFLDPDGYDPVAQQLLKMRRLSSEGTILSSADRTRAMEQLQQTTLQDDQAMLSSETSSDMKAALHYRIGIKQALARYSK